MDCKHIVIFSAKSRGGKEMGRKKGRERRRNGELNGQTEWRQGQQSPEPCCERDSVEIPESK